MYSDNSLSLLLDNYFLLYEGILPGDAGRTNLNGSPYESCCILKADLDNALINLDDRWYGILEAMDALSSCEDDPRKILEDKKYFKKLRRHLKAITRWHFRIHEDLLDPADFHIAFHGRLIMLRYLNSGITKKEYELVNKILKSLDFSTNVCRTNALDK